MRVPVLNKVTVTTTNHTSGWFVDKEETNPHLFFFYIECVCNAWFTIEILVSCTRVYVMCIYKINISIKRDYVTRSTVDS